MSKHIELTTSVHVADIVESLVYMGQKSLIEFILDIDHRIADWDFSTQLCFRILDSLLDGDPESIQYLREELNSRLDRKPNVDWEYGDK
jgi:hypothetical protein